MGAGGCRHHSESIVVIRRCQRRELLAPPQWYTPFHLTVILFRLAKTLSEHTGAFFGLWVGRTIKSDFYQDLCRGHGRAAFLRNVQIKSIQHQFPNVTDTAVVPIVFFQPPFFLICQPPTFPFMEFNCKLSKDLLHVDAVIVVDGRDRYMPTPSDL